jgi:hypothetical protein
MTHAIIADPDRDAFGHYFSGLTDGEGCFTLDNNRGYGSARFSMGLRADDKDILLTVCTYLGCGHVVAHKSTSERGCPQMIFFVTRAADLACHIVPHFEKYQLRAKKKAYFAIWKEAVSFLYQIKLRRWRIRRTARGQAGGRFPKWTADEYVRFAAFDAALKAQRQYQALTVTIPAPPPPERTLFDKV